MPTPSIQTLRADAQQVLNLDSISAVRSVVAATLANANAGTPLNPNLTTQQLWNEFYQIVTQPKSDIESIIANQLMKFLYAPPAPGGVGADKQVIFNDGGVLAGDPQFLWNKTTNLLTVTGAATISGDLTVDTSTLVVNSSQDRVAIGFSGNASSGRLQINQPLGSTIDGALRITDNATTSFVFNNVSSGVSGIWSSGAIAFGVGSGTFTEAMRLNATGLGVGSGPGLSGGSRRALTVNCAAGQLSILELGVNGTLAAYLYSNATQTSLVSQGATYLTFDTNSNERMRIDASGNVGIGVTPNTGWQSSWKALDIGLIGGVSYGFGQTDLASNVYRINTGAARYKAAGSAATSYTQVSGTHVFSTAGVAANAGDTITFSPSLTINASGLPIFLATTTTPASLTTNGELTFTATSNTNLRFSYRGSDGVTRVANLTLA